MNDRPDGQNPNPPPTSAEHSRPRWDASASQDPTPPPAPDRAGAPHWHSLVFKQLPDAACFLDSQDRVIDCNSAYRCRYPDSFSTYEVLHSSAGDHVQAYAGDPRLQNAIARQCRYTRVEEAFTLSDGTSRCFDTQRLLLHDGEGQTLLHLLAVDITEKTRILKRLRDSNQELERFAYVCSHDLQQPLRAMHRFSRKLASHLQHHRADDATTAHYLEFITEGAERAQMQVRDVLSYARLQREAPEPKIFDMEDLVRQAIAHVVDQEDYRNAVVTVGTLPKRVAGQKPQIYQLLINVIGNAIKYQRENSQPWVRIAAQESAQHWQFSVSDNGIGIEPRHFGKIFELFGRLHRYEDFPGTGIGLALCKRIVEQHGGHLWVESEKDKGAAFFFTLPKAIQNEA